MWGAAFEQNFRDDSREAAGGIEGPAKPKPAVQQEQLMRGEAADLHCAAVAERQLWMTCGEQFNRFQRLETEPLSVYLNRVKEVLSKMNLSPFQHCQNLKTRPLNHFHLHVGTGLRVAEQELRKDTFDVLRRGGHLEHSGFPAPQHPRPLTDCAGAAQETAAIAKQLLAVAG